MRLPVEELMGVQRESSAFKDFLSSAIGFLKEKDLYKENSIRVKEYEDIIYLDIPQIGLSFAFDNIKLDSAILGGIHVFKNVRQYRFCEDLELPLLNTNFKNLNAKAIVKEFGEPDKKSGGGGIAITLIYEKVKNTNIHLQFELEGSLWEDAENPLSILTYSR